jgi:uncharacterized protein involved in oxidation of intracellular sulfur
MPKILIILSHAPYGIEHAYNGLRLGANLMKHEGVEVKVFLLGDAATAAKQGQKVPSGYYNVQTMLSTLVKKGCKVAVCGTCMDARGMAETELMEGTHRSTMDELGNWTLEADKVLTL